MKLHCISVCVGFNGGSCWILWAFLCVFFLYVSKSRRRANVSELHEEIVSRRFLLRRVERKSGFHLSFHGGSFKCGGGGFLRSNGSTTLRVLLWDVSVDSFSRWPTNHLVLWHRASSLKGHAPGKSTNAAGSKWGQVFIKGFPRIQRLGESEDQRDLLAT